MPARMEILEWGEVRVNFQDMTTIFFLEWFSIAKASSAKCQLISIFIAPPYIRLTLSCHDLVAALRRLLLPG